MPFDWNALNDDLPNSAVATAPSSGGFDWESLNDDLPQVSPSLPSSPSPVATGPKGAVPAGVPPPPSPEPVLTDDETATAVGDALAAMGRGVTLPRPGAATYAQGGTIPGGEPLAVSARRGLNESMIGKAKRAVGSVGGALNLARTSGGASLAQPESFQTGEPIFNVPEPPVDPTLANLIVQGATTAAADLPAMMAAGAAVPAIPEAAMAGRLLKGAAAFAPLGAGKTALDQIAEGGFDPMEVVKAGGRDALVGMAMEGAAIPGRPAASFLTQGGAMTATQAALDQRLPSPQEVAANAVLLAGMHNWRAGEPGRPPIRTVSRENPVEPIPEASPRTPTEALIEPLLTPETLADVSPEEVPAPVTPEPAGRAEAAPSAVGTGEPQQPVAPEPRILKERTLASGEKVLIEPEAPAPKKEATPNAEGTGSEAQTGGGGEGLQGPESERLRLRNDEASRMEAQGATPPGPAPAAAPEGVGKAPQPSQEPVSVEGAGKQPPPEEPPSAPSPPAIPEPPKPVTPPEAKVPKGMKAEVITDRAVVSGEPNSWKRRFSNRDLEGAIQAAARGSMDTGKPLYAFPTSGGWTVSREKNLPYGHPYHEVWSDGKTIRVTRVEREPIPPPSKMLAEGRAPKPEENIFDARQATALPKPKAIPAGQAELGQAMMKPISRAEERTGPQTKEAKAAARGVPEIIPAEPPPASDLVGQAMVKRTALRAKKQAEINKYEVPPIRLMLNKATNGGRNPIQIPPRMGMGELNNLRETMGGLNFRRFFAERGSRHAANSRMTLGEFGQMLHELNHLVVTAEDRMASDFNPNTPVDEIQTARYLDENARGAAWSKGIPLDEMDQIEQKAARHELEKEVLAREMAGAPETDEDFTRRMLAESPAARAVREAQESPHPPKLKSPRSLRKKRGAVSFGFGERGPEEKGVVEREKGKPAPPGWFGATVADLADRYQKITGKPLQKPTTVKDADAWKRVMESDIEPETIAKKILDDPNFTPSNEDNIAMQAGELYHQHVAETWRGRAKDESLTVEARDRALVEMDLAEAKQTDLIEAQRLAGSRQGRALRSRQTTLDESNGDPAIVIYRRKRAAEQGGRVWTEKDAEQARAAAAEFKAAMEKLQERAKAANEALAARELADVAGAPTEGGKPLEGPEFKKRTGELVKRTKAERAPEGPAPEADTNSLADLAEHLVKHKGVQTFDNVVKVIQHLLPDVTRDEIADALTAKRRAAVEKDLTDWEIVKREAGVESLLGRTIEQYRQWWLTGNDPRESPKAARKLTHMQEKLKIVLAGWQKTHRRVIGVDRQMRSLEKQIAAVEHRLKTEAFKNAAEVPTVKPENDIQTPELKALRDRLKGLRQHERTLAAAERAKEKLAAEMRAQGREAKRAVFYKPGRVQKSLADMSEAEVLLSKLRAEMRIREVELKKGIGRRFLEGANNITRGINAGVLDASAVLNQARRYWGRNPVKALKFTGRSLRAFASEKAAIEMQAELTSNPEHNYRRWEGHRLDLKDPTTMKIGPSEEGLMRGAIGLIPGAKGSNRAYVTMLNEVRLAWANDLADRYQRAVDRPLTKEEFEAIATQVNNATRSTKSRSLDPNVNLLTDTLFYSLKARMGDWQYLTLKGVREAPTPKLRRMLLADMARTAAGGMGWQMAIAALTGGVMTYDPRRAEWMEPSVATQSVDDKGQAERLWLDQSPGGNKGIANLLARIGDYVARHNKEGDNGPKYGEATPWDTAGNYGRKMLAPLPGAVVSVAIGKDVTGKPTSIGREVVKMAPMGPTDIVQAFRKLDVDKAALPAVLAFFGQREAIYAPTKPKPSGLPSSPRPGLPRMPRLP